MNSKDKRNLFKDVFSVIHSISNSLPFSFASNSQSSRIKNTQGEKSFITETKDLSETTLSIKIIKALNMLSIYNTIELSNIDILQLYKLSNIQISTKMIDELLDFLIDNNINFVNRNDNHIRLSLCDISPTLKKALYKLGYFYLEDLINIDLNIFSSEENCPTSLIDDLINVLDSNHIDFLQKKENFELINKYNLSSSSKSVLYRTNYFYKEDLNNIDIKKIFSTYNCGPAVINELLNFFDKNNIYYLKYKENLHKLMDFNLPYEVLNIFYKNNYYFYEDIESLEISDIKNLKGIFPKIVENIIDFLIDHKFENFKCYENVQRISSLNITTPTISALYKAGIYFITDEIEIEKIIEANPNIASKTIDDIKKVKQLLTNNKDKNDNNNDTRRIVWDKYQVALLIDTYFLIEDGKISYSDGKKNLSLVFRNHAISQGFAIPENYRNENGIGACLEHIRFLYSNYTKGLSHYSNLEKEIVDLQKKHPDKFNTLLFEAKEIYDVYDRECSNGNLQNFVETNNKVCYSIKSYDYNNLSVDDLGLSKRTLNHLKRFNIKDLNDLLKLDVSKFKQQSNVGNATIEELKQYLTKYLSLDDINNMFDFNNHDTSINNNTKKNDRDVEYSLDFLLQPISTIFDDNWILYYCEKFNLKNLGLFIHNYPNMFMSSDEIMMDEEFLIKEKIIIEKLESLGIKKYPIAFTDEQIDVLNQCSVSESFAINYEEKIFSKIKELLTVNNAKFEEKEKSKNLKNKVLSSKEVEILLKRNGINCEKMTLEELGKNCNLTRERIRQIEKRAILKINNNLSSFLSVINIELTNFFNEYGLIFYNEKLFNIEHKAIIESLLNSRQEQTFNINYEFNLITSHDLIFDNLLTNVSNKVKSSGVNFVKEEDLKKFIQEELCKYVLKETPNQIVYFNKLLTYIFEKLINTQFIHIENDLYKYKSLSKKTVSGDDKKELIAYHFKKLYKDPVYIPQRNEKKLKEDLKDLFQVCPFLNNYVGTGSIERLLKENESIIFYGMGKYIHIDNTNVKFEILDTIVKDILNLFKLGKKYILPTELYNSHYYEYKDANIPDEYALIGLIKYRNHKNITCDIRRMKILPCGEIHIEAEDINNGKDSDIDFETINKIKNTLSKFSQGLNIIMVNITVNKFKQKYIDLYGEECLFTKEELINILKNIGIHYGNVILSPDSLLELDKKTYLINYIDTLFNDVDIIYIDCIFKQFEDVFLNSKIESVEILSLYLKNIFNTKYYVTKEFITTDINIDPSPLNNIKAYLYKEKTIKTKSQIYEEFYNYSENSIDSAISMDKEIITNKQNQEYFHYMTFLIDNYQLNQIKRLIDKEINLVGYITGTTLYDLIKKEDPNIILNNPNITPLGFRKTIAILLNDDFNFNGNIITKTEDSVNSTDILEKFFLKNNDEFSINDIQEISENIGRPNLAWDIIFKSHLRINENSFVRKNDDIFNVGIIDETLNSICGYKYTPIKSISIFEKFPVCKYTWNQYLLESYVYLYSDNYKLITTGFANSSVNGIIIKKDSFIKNLDDLLINVISDFPEDYSNSEILEKLKNNGYILRARLDNLEKLKIKAQEIRNKRRLN